MILYGRDDATDQGDWGDVFRGAERVPRPVMMLIRAFLKCVRDDMVTRWDDEEMQRNVDQWLARTDDEVLSPRWIASVLQKDVRPMFKRLRERGRYVVEEARGDA